MATGESTAFGVLLRRYRAAAHLTQRQLAARSGMSLDAMAALERGTRRPPPPAMLDRLADALALSDAQRADFQAAIQPLAAVLPASAPLPAANASHPNYTRQRRITWMPLQPTPLVGRSQEIEIILRMLSVESVRLLTLVGPAGVGKTRLALASAATESLADHFSDGMLLVDLTPIRAPQDVLGAIGRAYGFTDTGHPPLLERLIASLQDRETLLVLDNFEQVLPAAASLAALLAACPNLALLVTSRAPLHIRWEQTLRVAPLPVPDLAMPLPRLAELMTFPSVTLFLDRAQSRRAHFALTEKHASRVAQLVAHLDGLPLALELAAARLDMLSLPTLTQRLADRLQLLAVEAPDLPERQQSLEAAVGWSYDLLSEGEQRLFRCLGVFVGRVTLDAIATVDDEVQGESIEGGNGEARGGKETGHTLRRLLSLAEKSLLLPGRPEGPSRENASATEPEDLEDEPEDELEPAFTMLETVREYAEEQLVGAGELVAAQHAHAHYFLALAEQADPQLRGGGQQMWYRRLEPEQNNLRAALRWLLDQDDEAEREAGLRLAMTLGWFWWRRGYYAESRRWLEEALARTPRESDLGARTRALAFLGSILLLQGEAEQARATLEEALTLAEQKQDLAGIAESITGMGLRAIFAGELAEATRLLHEALRRWEALSNPWRLGLTQAYLGQVADVMGDVASAVAHFTASLEQYKATGDTHGMGFIRCYLGMDAWKLGDLRGAVAQVRSALETSVAFRDRLLCSIAAQTAVALVGASVAIEQRARLLGAVDALAEATGAAIPWERSPGYQEMIELRTWLARGEGESAAYRQGRILPVTAVAALAMSQLDEMAQALPHSETTPESAQSSERIAQRRDRSALTVREQEVLRLVAQGFSSKAIGRQLFIATRTVNYHLTSVFNKLGVDTRAQAAAVATQRGLL